MPRLMLSDELWSKLEKILLQQSIYHKPDLRVTVEGMLYRMRVGLPSERPAQRLWVLELCLQTFQCLVGVWQVAQRFQRSTRGARL